MRIYDLGYARESRLGEQKRVVYKEFWFERLIPSILSVDSIL